MAGLFWATAKSEKQSEKLAAPAQVYKRRMSEPPNRPNLTPQFCFNQTALQGELEPLAVAGLG